MNTLEDRLRETLAERAQHSPIDPDAWDKTVARGRRRVPRGWLSRPDWFHPNLMLPAAAAAAVAVIVIAATTLTGPGGSSRRAPGTSSSASPTSGGPTPPAPPGRNDYLIQSTPPVTAIVPVSMNVDGQLTWTFLWFGYLKNDRAEGIALCSVTDGGAFYGSGGCAPISLQAQQGSVEGTGSIRLGIAAKQVTSARALLSGGRSVAGKIVNGAGFPDKVWLVNYPSEDTATIILRDAAGREVAHSTITGDPPPPSRPHSGGILVFRYPGGRVTGYLLANGYASFWNSDGSSTGSIKPVSRAPLQVFQLPPSQGQFGYAPADVARVVLRLADGREYSAPTIAGWPGSGLRLWGPITLPATYANPGGTMVLTLDSAGHVIGQVLLISLR